MLLRHDHSALSRRLLLSLVVIALASLPLMASAQAGESIVVYSGRNQELIGPLIQQFIADTGIDVQVRYGATSEMALAILEEGANSPADVFIAQDAGALGALAGEGRLVRLPGDILERVEPRFRADDGRWVGLSGRARTVVYNTDMLAPGDLPDSIWGYTAPEWKGRVGWAPTNGSFQAFVTALRVAEGEARAREWLEAMLANDAHAYENNSHIVAAVGAGEVAVGFVNHYYVLRAQAEAPDFPATNHFMREGDIGALVNVAGAGIVDTSQNKGLAQRFILYLLSSSAQAYFAQTTYEYPLVAGVPAVEGLPPLDALETPRFDLSDLADLEGTVRLLQEVGALP